MSNVRVKIALQDPNLEDKELQADVQDLLQQIQEDIEVEYADLVPVKNAPDESKPLGGFLLGVLMAEVNPKNFSKLTGFLATRLSGKTIEMEVSANGKQIKLKANSLDELREMMKTAQEFVND